MSRFVRASKYRHVYGTGTANKRDQCFDNLKVSKNAWDTNLVKANPLFISVNLEASGGGAFAILKHDQTGKLPESNPVVNGHTGAVLDTDFHPFNDHIIASASEDCTVKIWSIPQDGLTENLITPVVSLNSHGRKVGHVLFHPTAENLLTSASADFTVKLWDISTGQEKQTLTGHTEIIQSLSYSYNGSLLVTTCKDKKLRIFDVRTDKVVQETNGHAGIKGSRVNWMGPLDKLVTSGFSRSSDRQLFVWDTNNLSEPLKQENVDTASGMLMPYYDESTSMLFVAGKGDGNIRYYEWVDDEKGLYFLSEYKSADPQRGIGFLPKRAVNVNDVEVTRAYKVHVGMVEPISFKVPRKSDAFQADLFPDCIGAEPSVTLEEFFNGVDRPPKLISLENGFSAQTDVKEFVSTAPPPVTEDITGPKTEKEYQDAYHTLRKENDDLKNAIASRDIRITQLEAQLAAK
ncbi:Coronin-2B [Clydaea vesicula]|uniref:Coronin n=1 Tax=Clydaea vesicula TaxID=447962 RepID=A0AAD5U7P7_9FUNG|nr:Coronin-2B [Clydaea vesicula]KAJ3384965.1 Coronin-2B [Lobulomyces angularis]